MRRFWNQLVYIAFNGLFRLHNIEIHHISVHPELGYRRAGDALTDNLLDNYFSLEDDTNDVSIWKFFFVTLDYSKPLDSFHIVLAATPS